jgi:FOG: Ankyrin repeat
MRLRQDETAGTATGVLWKIAETDNTDQVEALLAGGVDINVGNTHGTTALMRAASNGRIRMVHSLLNHGADPNKSRNDGFTPLHLAAFFGHAEVVRILLEHGARVDAATRFGTSAQMWASARTFPAVVQVLKNNPSVHELEERPRLTSSIQQIRHAEPNAVVVSENRVDETGIHKVVPDSGSRAIQTRQEPSSQPELRDLVLAELTSQVQPSNRNVMLYASAGVVLIAAVFVSIMFRHQQQRNEVTLPITPVATANGAKVEVFSQTLGADTTTTSEAPPAKVEAIPGTNTQSNVENSFNRPERANVSTRISTSAVKQTRAKLESLPAATNQSSIDLQARDLPAGPAPVAKPKAVASGNPEPSRPAPQTTQLITPSNNSTLKGKVIQWP